MERELLMTGIGGQGVQLAAQVLARAVIAEGRQVQVFGSYGGMMRGGNTDATLVFADGPVESPPTVGRAWSAIVMHPDYAGPVVARVVPGGLLMINTSVCPDLPEGDMVVVQVRATDIAIECGNVMAASMVMVGAYARVTGLVSLPSLAAAVAASLPPYRTRHVELNEAALRAGYDRTEAAVGAPAWTAVPA